MEQIQVIKKRISSIESTRQITQSMRLISTAKAQRARDRAREGAPFLEQAKSLAALAWRCMDADGHPYLDGRPVNNTLLVVISGDRGLCGGYNINVARLAMALAEEKGRVNVITIGSKARDLFRRRKELRPLHTFTGMSESPFFEDVQAIAGIILELYDSGAVDEVLCVYTRFYSMLKQEPHVQRLLPLIRLPDEGEGTVRSLTRYEPGGDAFLRGLVPFYLSAYLYGALLEAASCEQCARLASMDSAAKNAGEMIGRLTRLYNQARQGAITQEIIEIVSGAESVH